MTNKVLFIRSFTPDFDGKFNKYRQALELNNISWSFLGWDRSGENFQSKYKNRVHLYRKKAYIGGGWKNILNIVLWNIFIAKYIFKNRKSIDVLHIIDFDSTIFSYPIARLLRKKIIFDVYDKYTSMRHFPTFLKKIVDIYERHILKNANIAILADECRLEQHSIIKDDRLLILENVPTYEKIPYTNLGLKSDTNKFSLGYFGVLEKDNRGLEDTVEAIIATSNWEFHIAGYGELEDFFKEKAKQYPNKIKFYGAQSPETGLAIMNNMDVLLGLYYKNIPNHLYAAPNKYYEHLILNKPLITTEGTPPGNKVVLFDTGFAIAESKDAVVQTLRGINIATIEKIKEKTKLIWAKNYNTYFNEKYISIYSQMVKKL